jgi:hypothetical protein
MAWLVNELSLQDQYQSERDLLIDIERLLAFRHSTPTSTDEIRVSRNFGFRPALRGRAFNEVVMTSGVFRGARRSVLEWVTRTGPFFDEQRTPVENDYFEFDGEDVTRASLGEAARLVLSSKAVQVVSLSGGVTDFCHSPLRVDHGVDGDRYGHVDVPNCWDLAALPGMVRAQQPRARNWEGLLAYLRLHYPLLSVPDEVFSRRALSSEAYEESIALSVIALCGHLSDFMTARQELGRASQRCNELVNAFFAGANAKFTGESATNQRDFKDEMTFLDPSDANLRIFAHWHGKISHRYFRMHFEWPVPEGAQVLKILYLGPKITKA